MRTLTASIPHQLTRDEARRRIQSEIARARREFGSQVHDVQETWTGDRLDFSVAALGQTVRGFLLVEDTDVRVSVELPWLLAMFAGPMKQRIENDARKLLSAPLAG